MKNILYILSFIFILATSCSTTGNMSQDNGDNYYDRPSGYNYNSLVSYDLFYSQLSPYGDWVTYPGYGYVWVPAVRSGFRPYETNGYWVPTVDGWAWASNYNWGWAPFHYGRWMMDPALGWAWIPGYDWAPAWVQWGRYNNYYAWAPLGPGAGYSNYMAPADYWTFAPCNSIHRRNLDRYTYQNVNRSNVVNNITIINNYNTNNNVKFNRGPDYKEVEQVSNMTIKPVPVASTTRPGRAKVDNQFKVYKPAVTADNASTTKPTAPSRVVTVDEMRTKKQSLGTETFERNTNNDNARPGASVKQGTESNKANADLRKSTDIYRRKQAERYEAGNANTNRYPPVNQEVQATPPVQKRTMPAATIDNASVNNQSTYRSNPQIIDRSNNYPANKRPVEMESRPVPAPQQSFPVRSLGSPGSPAPAGILKPGKRGTSEFK